MQVDIEILEACGDYTAGQRLRLEDRRAQKLLRTGFARQIETADAGDGEQAVKPRGSTRTVRGERRG